ncbi:MAG: hypothetical protein M3Q97_04670 [Bacteroidota bacterium]|nr:hypothetical protein [Bacteroidota bacterium]
MKHIGLLIVAVFVFFAMSTTGCRKPPPPPGPDDTDTVINPPPTKSYSDIQAFTKLGVITQAQSGVTVVRYPTFNDYLNYTNAIDSGQTQGSEAIHTFKDVEPNKRFYFRAYMYEAGDTLKGYEDVVSPVKGTSTFPNKASVSIVIN